MQKPIAGELLVRLKIVHFMEQENSLCIIHKINLKLT